MRNSYFLNFLNHYNVPTLERYLQYDGYGMRKDNGPQTLCLFREGLEKFAPRSFRAHISVAGQLELFETVDEKLFISLRIVSCHTWTLSLCH